MEVIKTYSDVVLTEAPDSYSKDRKVAGETLTLGQAVAIHSGTGKVHEYDPAGSNGLNIVAGIVVSTGAELDEKVSVMRRHCQVESSEVIWNDGISAGDITTATAALESLGVVLR